MLHTYFKDLKGEVVLIFNSVFAKHLFGAIVLNMAGGATFAVLAGYGNEINNPSMYGFLLTAQSLGALAGAIVSPYLNLETFKLGRLYAIAFLICGLLWSVSVFAPFSWLTLLLFGLAWIPGGATNVIVFSALQKMTPKSMLG